MNQEKSNILPVVICVILLCYFAFSPIIALIMGLSGSDSEKTALAASAMEPPRVQELMLIKAFDVPPDIIMMIASYLSKTAEEALEKPLIFYALEFLILSEEVKEKHHDHDGDEDCHCEYVTVASNRYEFKTGIKGYLGISNEETSDLSAGNLIQKAGEVADERCRQTAVDDIRLISFNAVFINKYEEAIKRCGIKKEKDIEDIIELHKADYFTEWLEGNAKDMGVETGGSAVIGGSTHNEIRRALMSADKNVDFFGGPAGSPLPSGSYYISCEFGPRDFAPDPMHTGLDFSAPAGTPIYSVMDGIIMMRVTNMNTFGHHIVVFHGGNVTTMYAHMSAFGSFKVGDEVKRGDVIGYVGTTGLSTGNHLHFEYQIDGYAYNPRSILPLL